VDRIARYCEGDVLKSLEIAFSWMGQPMLPVAEKQEEVKAVELPLLQRIYKAEFIDEATKNSIKEKLSKKKLTKKDKEYLEDILTSLYISNEMFKSDKPEVKERKIKEIKELING
jgi:hypothetical protein